MRTDPTATLEGFLEAFNAADLDNMRRLLAEDAVAFVTDRDGREVRLDGAAAYLAAIDAMDLSSTDYRVTLTQPPVIVADDQGLAMVEVNARRGDRKLHNFAAYFYRVDGGLITELRMVDAKPAESDQFWAQPMAEQ
jgi:ketosteroid isomerase-like protein